MAQSSTTVVTKSTTDLLTAAEVNNMNTVINGNATDAESRIAALEVSVDSSVITKQIIVNEAADLAGTLDSTAVYIINGIIDMGSQSIEIPAGGLNLAGLTFDVSKLTSSALTYTMFTSPVGGSGNLLGKDYAIEVTGAGSQVYDITDSDGTHAFEFARVNYNGCTSLGTIDGYRQGFETGTGRFGGAPELTLAGTWAGGYFIDSSIVRGLSAGMTGSLFKAGVGFTMASRFRSNQNIDLPASASFFDFSPSNFSNPSTVQLTGCIISRNGTFDATDSNITPNMTRGDVESVWKSNIGIENTFEGGQAGITVEAATTVTLQSTFYDLNGTWTTSDLQHFDSPSNGQLRHLGNNPREFDLNIAVTLASTANNEVDLKVVKWDDSAAGFVDLTIFKRQVNNLVGGRDVAFFTVGTKIELDQNDYIKLQVSNESSTADITAELGSFFQIEER